MKADVFEGALRATAKIACLGALASISCRSTPKADDSASQPPLTSGDTAEDDTAIEDTGPAVEPGSEPAAEPAAEPSQPASEPTTEPSQPASEPTSEPDTGGDPLQECHDLLDDAFGNGTTTPEPQLLDCCTDIVETLSYDQLISWAHYDNCCDRIIESDNWGTACTPWGPPTPPKMPRRLRRLHQKIA